VDRTRLTGVYALRLEWRENGKILSALKDLGLKIRSQRDFVEMLVLDRLDRPAEN
jgi:uncharacterized protein (TIGR03435 family)